MAEAGAFVSGSHSHQTRQRSVPPMTAVSNNSRESDAPVEQVSMSSVNTAAVPAAASAEDRAMMHFGDGYQCILEAIGDPGYQSMKALFFGEDGPPANTIPPITVSFELFEAVQSRFAKTKTTLDRTKEDLHARHQQIAVLQGEYEQLQEAYDMLEVRNKEMERKNTQLHQDIAKQDVMAEQLRQQITRLKTEAEIFEEKMIKRDEELQTLHQRVAEGLVALSQKETIIANLRRQLGWGGFLKRNSNAEKPSGDSSEYTVEALERIAADVEGRSTESQLRLRNLELEAKVRTVTEERKYIMLRHKTYRSHVQSVTEAYEALCMSKEDAVRLHVCEVPPVLADTKLLDSRKVSISNDVMSFDSPRASRRPSRSSRLSQPSVRQSQEDKSYKKRLVAERKNNNSDNTQKTAFDFVQSIESIPGNVGSDKEPSGSTSTQQYLFSVPMKVLSRRGSQEHEMEKTLSFVGSVSSGDSLRSKETLHSNENSPREYVSRSGLHSADMASTNITSTGSRKSIRQKVSHRSPVSRESKSTLSRDKGTEKDRRSGVGSNNDSPLAPAPPGRIRHSKQSFYSPSMSFSSLLRTADRSELSTPSARSAASRGRRKKIGTEKSVSPNSFVVTLPTFEQQSPELGGDVKNASLSRSPSGEHSRSGKSGQWKDKKGAGSPSVTKSRVHLLAKKYGDLHAVLLDFEKLLAPAKEKGRLEGLRSAMFNPDEKSESVVTQADYIASAVASDTELLLHLLRHVQRTVRSDEHSRLENAAPVATIQDVSGQTLSLSDLQTEPSAGLQFNRSSRRSTFEKNTAQSSLGGSLALAPKIVGRTMPLISDVVEGIESVDKLRGSGNRSSLDKRRDSASRGSADKHKTSGSRDFANKDKSSGRRGSLDKRRDSASRGSADKHKTSGSRDFADKDKSSGRRSSLDKRRDSASRGSADKHKTSGSRDFADKDKSSGRRSALDKRRDSASRGSADKHDILRRLPEKERSTTPEKFNSSKGAPNLYSGGVEGFKGLNDAAVSKKSPYDNRSDVSGMGSNMESGEPLQRNVLEEDKAHVGTLSPGRVSAGRAGSVGVNSRPLSPSRNNQVGDVKQYTPRPPSVERRGGQHASIAGHLTPAKGSREAGKQQKESQRSPRIKKAVGTVSLPKISSSGGQTEKTVSTGADASVIESALPCHGGLPRHTAGRVVNRVRCAPPRRPWPAAVVRLDLDDLQGFTEERQSHLQCRFGQMSMAPTSAFWGAQLGNALVFSDKHVGGGYRHTDNAYAGLVIDATRCGGSIGTGVVASSSGLPPLFSPRSMPSNQVVLRDLTETKRNSFELSGTSIPLPASDFNSPPRAPTHSQTLAFSSPVMNQEIQSGATNMSSRLGQLLPPLRKRQEHLQQLRSDNSFSYNHKSGERYNSGLVVEAQPLVVAGIGVNTGEFSVLSLPSVRDNILAHVLRRRPVLWQHSHVKGTRWRHIPQTLINCSMRRQNSGLRRKRGLLAGTYTHFLSGNSNGTSLRCYRRYKKESLPELCIGLPRRFGIPTRLWVRRQYAKRPPRHVSFVKRCVLLPRQLHEEKVEFFPLVIKSLGV